MRIEVWNGYKIRFIEKDSGEWWAVVKDVAEALGFRDARAAVRNISPKFFHTHKVCMEDISRKMLIVSEKGLHRLIMRSNKPEAEEFQDWVCDVLIQFRQKSGLESYQVFRMLDKDHQKDMMALLWKGLNKPEKVIYIQANIIANKAIERKYKEQQKPKVKLRRTRYYIAPRVIEKSNMAKFIINLLIRILKTTAVVIVFLLASIGLLCLIYPEPRNALFTILNNTFNELKILIGF